MARIKPDPRLVLPYPDSARTGPYRDRTGIRLPDPAMGGMMSITDTDEEGGQPTKVGVGHRRRHVAECTPTIGNSGALRHKEDDGRGPIYRSFPLRHAGRLAHQRATTISYRASDPERIGNAHPNMLPIRHSHGRS
ncbi:hypothetical protein F2981_25390 (plasmid) [Sinorhizobium meliloti]|nr:hypothetical protein [Sinorhizobium meliloti]